MGPSRPGAAARRRTLGMSGGEGGEEPAGPEDMAGAARCESLIEALSRIPDLDADGREAGVAKRAAVLEPPLGDGTDGSSTRAAPTPGPRTEPRPAPPASREGPSRPHRERTSDVATWRRAAFALAIVVLVAAIPALALAGYRIISNSRAGQFTSTDADPTAPGYMAQVDRTRTAAVIQYDAKHVPVGVTFLSLASPKGGGGVIFFPLGTEVPGPRDGINRLRDAGAVLASKPDQVRDRTALGVAALLNVGIQDVIEVDDARLAALATPVAPLVIDSPEALQLRDGTTVASGRVQLTAAQIGPYFAATKRGETETAQLNRSKALWTAWLAQVKASTAPAPVGGETTAGMGLYLLQLAKGNSTIETLPVVADGGTGSAQRFKPESAGITRLVTELVPSPTGAAPDFRYTVRLLNGVSAGEAPSSVTRLIVRVGGTVTVVGNPPSFGQERTSVVYADPRMKDKATYLLRALGGTGKVVLDREAPDTTDLTLVLGRDILGAPPPTTTTEGT